MKIERPEIYFGEKSQDYIIVNTKTDEFDYPIGESNSYNTEVRGIRWSGPFRPWP